MLDNVYSVIHKSMEHTTEQHFDSTSATVNTCTSATVIALTHIPKCNCVFFDYHFCDTPLQCHTSLSPHSNTFKVYLPKLFLLGGPKHIIHSVKRSIVMLTVLVPAHALCSLAHIQRTLLLTLC